MITVVKRNGVKPLRIKKMEGITVFLIADSFEEDAKSYERLIKLVELLAPENKIILNFGSDERNMGSRIAVSLKEVFVPIQNEYKNNIAVCGLENSTFAVQEYFEHYFPVFPTLDDAIDYLHEK